MTSNPFGWATRIDCALVDWGSGVVAAPSQGEFCENATGKSGDTRLGGRPRRSHRRVISSPKKPVGGDEVGRCWATLNSQC